MSIAKREAEKLLIFAKIYKKADLRNNVITLEGANDIAEAAYISGRTAKPTEAEIEAAASVIALNVGNRILSKKLIKDALAAARKVVTE
jgi:hypothetical protein